MKTILKRNVSLITGGVDGRGNACRLRHEAG